MHYYVRRARFTTTPRLFVHSYSFKSTAVGIHLRKDFKIYSCKTKRGFEICLSDVKMHKG